MVEISNVPKILKLIEKIRVAVEEERFYEAVQEGKKVVRLIDMLREEKFMKERTCETSGHFFSDEWFDYNTESWTKFPVSGFVRTRQYCIFCSEKKDDKYIEPLKIRSLGF